MKEPDVAPKVHIAHMNKQLEHYRARFDPLGVLLITPLKICMMLL